MATTGGRASAAEATFPAMGGEALVIVHGDASLTRVAQHELARLERRFSRFLPDSDVSRINAGAGRPIVVGSETAQLVEMSIQAWRATRGAFDPTLGHEVSAAGYDRPFVEIRDRDDFTVGDLPERRSRCGDIVVDLEARTVLLPADLQLDLGGIAKGFAADLTVGLLLDRGAIGSAVSLGGDVRVAGDAPGGHGWGIAVEDPDESSRELAMLAVASGGVATTSTRRRRWTTTDGTANHIIDPRSRRSAETDLVQVTAIAVDGASAEVLATAGLLMGAARLERLANDAGVALIAVTASGGRVDAGNVAPFLR
jgi:thiamine biosynthesis lipoprotein